MDIKFKDNTFKNDIKKDLAKTLQDLKIIDDDSVGQIVAHINNGGVTKICRNNWEIK